MVDILVHNGLPVLNQVFYFIRHVKQNFSAKVVTSWMRHSNKQKLQSLSHVFVRKKGLLVLLLQELSQLVWHISWYLNFLLENRKNDWFPARKNQETSYVTLEYIIGICNFTPSSNSNQTLAILVKHQYNLLQNFSWSDFDQFCLIFCQSW